jgi:malonate decarboxylase delta subunit
LNKEKKMESSQFTYQAGKPAASKVLAGVVGSGDLEVLIEPGRTGTTQITVNTSVDGSGHLWQALFDRIFTVQPNWPAMAVEINDFAATPGVVRMRLEQALDLLNKQSKGK